MEFLYEKLPKDLANIIEEYAKDRTNYDQVVKNFNNYMKDFVTAWILDKPNLEMNNAMNTICSNKDYYQLFLWCILPD